MQCEDVGCVRNGWLSSFEVGYLRLEAVCCTRININILQSNKYFLLLHFLSVSSRKQSILNVNVPFFSVHQTEQKIEARIPTVSVSISVSISNE